MPQTSRFARISLITLGLALSGAVIAQDRGSSGTTSEITSDRQMIDDAADALTKMQDYSGRVLRLKEVVDREGDLEKGVICVQAAQQRVDTLIAVAKRAEADLKAALASGQRERAEHEYRKIAVARAKVQQLYAEADACVGGSSTGQDQAEVSWTAEGLKEAEETDSSTEALDVVGVDPPNTSPFE